MIGQTISHYRILEKLGEGGMGVVYKAQDTKLRREVAIKVLPSGVAEDPDGRRRFEVEAQAAAALNHQNITTIHSVEEAAGVVFIVMEFVDGRELRHILRSGPMDLEQVVDVMVQLAEGLQAAHDKGVVHRDIKSSNVLVTAGGCAKIMDFGVARLRGVSQLTKPGTTVGTTAYMSPEQIQGAGVDHRTDLWSLGVLLYEMVAGELPFKGEFEAAVIYEILNEEPETLQSHRSDVPNSIVSLVSQMLQKDPRRRVSSAREVIDRLRSRSVGAKTTEKKKSIAVLYFENMSSEKENEYFCAGMTEDLIIDLSKIRGLRVIPRSDVMPFRDKEVNSRQVGEILSVDYILEGSVRKANNRMRITAQMIDVHSGFQVWGERYDRLIEDIFDVQIEVSETIAEALKVSLTETERQSLAQKPTDDIRAYDFYLRGSELLSRRWQGDRQTAVKMFEHALSIDPHFALAYVALAEAHSYNYMFFAGGRESLEKMMEMNEKALSIDPDLIEAKFGVGMAYFHQKRFAKAKQEFQKVIDFKSDFYPAHYWLIWTLIVLGEFHLAIEYAKSAATIKPYSEEPWHLIEHCQRKKGQSKAADEAGGRVVDLARRKLEVNPKDVMALSRMAIADANRGNRREAIDAIQRVVKIDPADGMALYNCAGALGILDMKEKTIEFLAASFAKGAANLMEWIDEDPYLDSVRELPEFREMVSEYRV